MCRLKLTLLLLIIITSINVQAQKPGISLAQQYQEVVLKSGSYQGFKEIRQDKIDLFWKNIQDTLAREKQLLNETKAKLITAGQDVIKSKVTLETVEQELAQSKAQKDQINFLGMYLAKDSYHIMVWGLLILLIAALSFAIYRSKSAIKEARYRSGLFNDLSEEFQKHKVVANEKEKKLARELQTERNMISEMKGR